MVVLIHLFRRRICLLLCVVSCGTFRLLKQLSRTDAKPPPRVRFPFVLAEGWRRA